MIAYLNIYIYIYTHTFMKNKKHPCRSDTFKKVLLLKGSLPYGCFLRHFIYFFSFILLYSFIIDNAKPTYLFFKLHDLFQIAQSIICYIIDQSNAHWKCQWWPLSWFPVRFCFIQINYAYETKKAIHFIDICSKPYSAYILNSTKFLFML